MPGDPENGQLSDEVSLRIAAPADRVYAIITDIAQMGRLSPECTGGKWIGDATGPAVGASFKGSNKRGMVRWSTTNNVVAATPGEEFAFETIQSGTRWTYRLQADDDSTIVTESRAAFKDRPMLARVFTALLGGVEGHDDEMRAGMQTTLERLKQVAEQG